MRSDIGDLLWRLPVSEYSVLNQHSSAGDAHVRTPLAARGTAAVVGAGDFIGAAIGRKFAAEGYTVFLGRRQGELLEPVKAQIEAAGGRAFTRSLDARDEDQVTAFLADAEAEGPLERGVFNVGANVNFPLLETTSRVFRKVWEMACFAGFLSGAGGGAAHAAARTRLDLPHRRHGRPARRRRATRPSPAPSSACGRWPSRRRGSWDPRASTSPIW